MGMFDYISVSDKLPFNQEMKDLGLNINNHVWQTKDLDNTLSTYDIQGNRLFEHRYKVNNFIPGDPKADTFMDRMGHMERDELYYEPIIHHGEIYFYDYVNDVQGKWDCWIEFKAIFTNGCLDRYELVSFTKTDNAERKKMEKELHETLKNQKNIWYYKYIFHTKAYRKFSRLWYKFFTSLGNFFIKMSYKL